MGSLLPISSPENYYSFLILGETKFGTSPRLLKCTPHTLLPPTQGLEQPPTHTYLKGLVFVFCFFREG